MHPLSYSHNKVWLHFMVLSYFVFPIGFFIPLFSTRPQSCIHYLPTWTVKLPIPSSFDAHRGAGQLFFLLAPYPTFGDTVWPHIYPQIHFGFSGCVGQLPVAARHRNTQFWSTSSPLKIPLTCRPWRDELRRRSKSPKVPITLVLERSKTKLYLIYY